MNTGGAIGETAISIFKEHGAAGFFRGWTASYSRLGPHTIIIMNIYERLNAMAGLKGV
jgi:solute carrier family 25 uncoupling protein 8/9